MSSRREQGTPYSIEKLHPQGATTWTAQRKCRGRINWKICCRFEHWVQKSIKNFISQKK